MEKEPVFPFIKDRKAFLLDSIPNYHPDSAKYITYWREQKRRCIEGLWAMDNTDTEWRYMPPNLYFYVNFGTILHKEKSAPKTAPKKRMRPWLRDLEWAYFYNFMEARGFSGYKDDDVYTACHDVKMYNDGKLTREDLHPSCFNSNGDIKVYVDPRDYIRKRWRKPMDAPLYFNEAKNILLVGARGGGKLLEPDELIRVEDGWKTMKDIKEDDLVYDMDGSLSRVTHKTSLQKDVKMYKLHLRDGRSIRCCEDHQWYLWSKHKYRRNKENPYVVLSTSDLFNKYYTERVDSKHKAKYGDTKKVKEFLYAVPNNKPIDIEERDLPIDPYFLGLAIGDGHFGRKFIRVTSGDESILQYCVDQFKDSSYIKRFEGKNCSDAVIKDHRLIWDTMRLGLHQSRSHTKFIPKEYLYSSRKQRMELLRGLMDSDGYSDDRHIEYCTISNRLSDDFCELVRSLGISCRVTQSDSQYTLNGKRIKTGRTRYRVSIYTDKDIFKLPRKLKFLDHKKSKYGLSKHSKSFITKIEEDGYGDGYCISVDSPTKTYITKDYIVTHNTYIGAVGVTLYEILFDGARYYDEESRVNPAVAEVFVGAALSSKSSDFLSKMLDAFRNLPGVWARGTSEERPSPFYKQMSGSLVPNNMRNPWRHEYDKKISGEWKKMGTGSHVYHGIWTTENPEAAAGTRPGLILLDEVGLCPNILTVHNSNVATQMVDGTVKFGSSIYSGTGGNLEKVVETEILFRDPISNDFLVFDDEWENTGPIAWFVPATYMDGTFKDENGNTRVAEAEKHYLLRREEAKRSKSRKKLDLEMMNYPLKPSEMFLSAGQNDFPIADIKDRYANLMTGKELSSTWTGHFYISSTGSMQWKNEDKTPIYEYPLKQGDDMNGCVHIFEHPVKDSKGEIPSGVYIAGYDPVDDDDDTDYSRSLQSFWIMNTLVDKLVLEYTARTRFATEFYEQVRRALIYYNARVNYENQKKGFYGYMKNKNCLYLLADTPSILKDMDMQKSTGLGNKSKGTSANTAVNNWGIDMQIEWLQKQSANRPDGVTNVQEIKSPAYLRECILYDGDRNTDRISSMNMLMVYREEVLKRTLKMREKGSSSVNKQSSIGREMLSSVRRQKELLRYNGVTKGNRF